MPFELAQFPFVGGLEEKKDSIQVEMPAFVTLRNAVRKKTGRIEKRRGTLQRAVTAKKGTTAIADIAAFRKLLAYRSQLLAIDGTFLYASIGAPGSNLWEQADLIPGPEIRWRNVATASGNATDTDVCVINNQFVAYGWTSPDGLRLSVYELATGDAILSNFVVAAATTLRIKLLSLGLVLFCLFDDVPNGQIDFLKIDLSALPAITTSSGILIAGARVGAPNFAWDAATNGDATNFWVAFEANAGPNPLTIERFNVTPALQATGNPVDAATTYQAIGIYVTASSVVGGLVWIAYSPAAGIKFATVNRSSLANVAAATLVGGTSQALQLGVAEYETSVPQKAFIAGSDSGTTWLVKVDNTPAVLTTGQLRNFQMRSRPLFEVGRMHLHAEYVASTLQATDFILDAGSSSDDTSVIIVRQVGVVAPRSMGIFASVTVRQNSSVAHYAELPSTFAGGNTYAFVGSIATQLNQLGVNAILVDFAARGLWAPSDVGGNLCLSCGVPSVYDGNIVSEMSYGHASEGAVTLTPSVVGGNMSSGTYQYCFVFAWTDAQGNICRSAPSTPQTVTIGGAVVVGSVSTTSILPLRITAKQKGADGQRPKVVVEVYRTTNGPGSVFFRVGTVDNDPHAAFLSFTDTLPDTGGPPALLDGSRPQLYTTGGVLPNFCPPGFISMVQHKGRLFGLAGDGKTIWYTRSVVQGESPSWNDVLTIPVDEGGDGVALFSLDDTLLLFKTGTIFAIHGEGPADNGSGVDWTVQKVPSDVGCIEPRSLVLMPDGVVFQSRNGIYLLNRSFQVEWIGQPIVDSLASLSAGKPPEITSAVRIEDQHQVRLTVTDALHRNNIVIVWDYFHQAWSTFKYGTDVASKSLGITSACVYVPQQPGSQIPTYAIAGNAHPLAGSDSAYVAEEANDGIDYRDAGNYVSMAIVTRLKMAGLQGYYRARRLHVIGTSQTAHQLQITAQDEAIPANTQTSTWTDAQIAAFPYSLERVQMHLQTQKLVSMLVTLTDLAPLGAMGTGQGPSLSGLGLQFATKQRGLPLPSPEVE